MGSKFKIKEYIDAIIYSTKEMWSASKLIIPLYIFSDFIMATIPLLKIYVLSLAMNELSILPIDFKKVILYIGLIILVTIIDELLSFIYSYIDTEERRKIKIKQEIKYKTHLLKLPLIFVDSVTGRDIIEQAKNEVNSVQDFFKYFVSFASLIYSFIIAAVFMFSFNTVFSILLLFTCIPSFISGFIMKRVYRKFDYDNTKNLRYHSYYRWMLTDKVCAMDVRMYNLTEPIKKKYFKYRSEYLKTSNIIHNKEFIANTLTGIFQKIPSIAFTIYIIIAAVNRNITIGEIALYTGMSASLVGRFGDIFSSVDMMIFLNDNTKKLFAFYNVFCPDEIKGTKSIYDFESLEFKNVYFKYPSRDDYVLCGVSFVLKRGERMSIVGINGAGKTTIIKLMMGLYEIESGEILFNDCPIHDYNIKDIRKMFSVLFQEFATYPLTLRENIAMSDIKNSNDDQRILKAMTESGAYDEINKYKQGLDSFMSREFDDTGVELSRGQWQKIALARTYFKDAPIIVFDEPSAALDAESEDRIFNTFDKLSNRKTAVMISHRISSARMSDKIIVLNNGKIEECGTHDSLIAKNGLYAQMFEIQKRRYTLTEDDILYNE